MSKIDPSLGKAIARLSDGTPIDAFANEVSSNADLSTATLPRVDSIGSDGGGFELLDVKRARILGAIEVVLLLRELTTEFPMAGLRVEDHTRFTSSAQPGLTIGFGRDVRVNWSISTESAIELNQRRIAELRKALKESASVRGKGERVTIDLWPLDPAYDKEARPDKPAFHDGGDPSPPRKWFGPGAKDAPKSELGGSVSIEAPNNFPFNERKDVKFTFANPLDVPLTNVTLKAYCFDLDVISASKGFKPGNRKITWELTEIPAGEFGEVTVTYQLPNYTRTTPKETEIVGTIRCDQGVANEAVTVKLADHGPTYDGFPLYHWYDELDVEVAPEKTKKALKAIDTIANAIEPDQLEQASIAPLFRLLRRVGRSPGLIVENSYYNEKVWKIFVQLPHDRVVDEIIEEIVEGNANSRRFLFYFLQPIFGAVNVGPETMAKGKKLEGKLHSRFPELLDAIHRVDSEFNTDPESLDWPTEFLFQLITQGKPEIDDAMEKTIRSIFSTRFDSDDPKIGAMAAWYFSGTQRYPQNLEQKLVSLLSDPLTRDNQADMVPAKYLALRATARLKSGWSKKIVRPLIETLDSDLVKHPGRYVSGFTGPLPGLPEDTMRMGQFRRNYFREATLEAIRKCGLNAKEAVPYLLHMFDREQAFRPTLRKLLVKIDPTLEKPVCNYGGSSENAFGDQTGPAAGGVPNMDVHMIRLTPMNISNHTLAGLAANARKLRELGCTKT